MSSERIASVAERLVMREIRKKKESIAAVFIQTPWSQQGHFEAISEVKSVVTPVVDFGRLIPLSVSQTIKNLDASLAEQV